MSCKASLKYHLRLSLDNLEDDFNRFTKGYFNKFISAVNKLKNLENVSEYLKNDALARVFDKIQEVGADVASGSMWLVTQLIKQAWNVMPKGITALALLGLRDNLVKRVDVLQDIDVHLNIIKTSMHIIRSNLYPINNENLSIYARVNGAISQVRTALIRARQLISIWEYTGVYDDSLFRRIELHLEQAQDFLILPEIQAYQDDLQRLLDEELSGNIEDSGIINIEGLLDVAAAKYADPNSSAGRALIATRPLFDLLQGAADDEIAKILFAYKLGLQSILEIAKLTPYDPKIILSILSTSGHNMTGGLSAITGGVAADTDFFTRNVENRSQTLIELNGIINNKISALQNIENKWLNMDKITSPFIDYINDSAIELSAVYFDMKDTVVNTTNTNELIGKANAWSNQIADVQKDLLAVPPVVGQKLSISTTFVRDWNEVLYLIDQINPSDNLATTTYGQLFTNLIQLPASLTSREQLTEGITKIQILQRQLRRTTTADLILIDEIDDLQLHTLNELDTVRDILEFTDSVFPLLSEIIRNADVEKITKALEQIKDVYSDGIDDIENGLRNAGTALKGVVKSDNVEKVAECLASLDIDIDFDISFGEDGDEETIRDFINNENFYYAKKGELEGKSNVLDSGEGSLGDVKGFI